MGNSIRGFLKKAGCTDRVLNSLFASYFEHLISAIEKNDLESVKFFHLVKKVSFSDYLPSGDSPLHIAVLRNNLEIAKYIIEKVKPLNIEDKNFNGDTVFMQAALKGNLQMMKYLFEVGKCDINTKENKGATPFFAACCNGYLEILDYFLFELKIDCHSVNHEGQSAIHRVAYYGLLHVLKYLRKNTNLSFSAVDKKGNSPLHLAAIRLNITCIRYLLKHSSKKEVLLNQKNSEQETPLTIILKILNKIKDPGISEITKEEVIKYINDKKEFPAIRNTEVTSKLRQTLQASSMKKTDFFGKNRVLSNNLKIPMNINPFATNRSSKDAGNNNISPKTLKVNAKRELLLSRVTPVNTDKKNSMIASKTNLQEEIEIREENIVEIKSALVRKREKRGGRKNTSPSPDKTDKEKMASPRRTAGSPLNKLKKAFMNKFNSIKPSFMSSPKKKKNPVVNINKPQINKGLSFKEMHEKLTLEEKDEKQEDEEKSRDYERNENFEENKGLEILNDEENLTKSNGFNMFSLLQKAGKAFMKSPLNNFLKGNKGESSDGQENNSTPQNNMSHLLVKTQDMLINIPEDSPFKVLIKGFDHNLSEKEIKMKKNLKA